MYVHQRCISNSGAAARTVGNTGTEIDRNALCLCSSLQQAQSPLCRHRRHRHRHH